MAGADPDGPRVGLFGKIRGRGWRWFVARTVDEIRTPTTPAGQRIAAARRRFLRYLDAIALRLLPGPTAERPDALHYFFDLAICPITYDSCTYLAAANLARERLGCSDIVMVVVPGWQDGLRQEMDDYEAIVDKEERRWRLQHIVVAAAQHASCVGSIHLCADRAAAQAIFRRARHVFPEGYRPGMPVGPRNSDVHKAPPGAGVLPLLRAQPAALRIAKAFLNGANKLARPVVVIPLRQYGYAPRRNSNLAAWRDFAREIEARGYFPVFVRDTSAAAGPTEPELEGFARFDAAAYDLGLRLALFELAFVVIGVSQGPMELCWYGEKIRYVQIHDIDAAPQNGPDILNAHGIRIGAKQLSFARPGQIWIWGTDTLDTLRGGFEAFLVDIGSKPD